MSRPRKLDLTDQQQRVLELMARGRTNYDIAQELGISLEGAKYHIRQVFDKLGVDSREEAVAAWKASRGGVFERVRGFFWPVGAIAAGGVAVVAVVIVAGVMLMGGGGSKSFPASAEPGENAPANVWVADVIAGNDGAGQLEIFKAGDKLHAHIMEGTFYGVPFGLIWSRDGNRLSALGRDPQQSSYAIWTFTRAGDAWGPSTIPVAGPGAKFSWSPDGELLVVIDTERAGSAATAAGVFDHSGKQLLKKALPPVGDITYGIDYLPSWRSDSKAAAWGVNGRLLVLTEDGIHDYTPPGGAPHQRVAVARWSDDRHVAVILGDADGNETGYSVDVSVDDATWKRLDQPPATTTLPLQPTPSAAISALWNHPTNVPLVNEGVTADGSGTVYGPGYSPLSAGLVVDFQVIVELASGELVPVDLGARPAPSVGLGSAYNIVITK